MKHPNPQRALPRAVSRRLLGLTLVIAGISMVLFGLSALMH